MDSYPLRFSLDDPAWLCICGNTSASRRKALSHRAVFLWVDPPRRDGEERGWGWGAKALDGCHRVFLLGEVEASQSVKKKNTPHVQARERLQHPTSLPWARTNTTPRKDRLL